MSLLTNHVYFRRARLCRQSRDLGGNLSCQSTRLNGNGHRTIHATRPLAGRVLSSRARRSVPMCSRCASIWLGGAKEHASPARGDVDSYRAVPCQLSVGLELLRHVFVEGGHDDVRIVIHVHPVLQHDDAFSLGCGDANSDCGGCAIAGGLVPQARPPANRFRYGILAPESVEQKLARDCGCLLASVGVAGHADASGLTW